MTDRIIVEHRKDKPNKYHIIKFPTIGEKGFYQQGISLDCFLRRELLRCFPNGKAISNSPEYFSDQYIFYKSKKERNISDSKTSELILSSIISYVLKLDDAPASAQSHLDYAISMLSEMCPEWNPKDINAQIVLAEAREHMSYYYPQFNEVKHKNVWEFYKYINYNYKKQKYE